MLLEKLILEKNVLNVFIHNVCVWRGICLGTHVEIRRQLVGIGSVFVVSGIQLRPSLVAVTFTHCAILPTTRSILNLYNESHINDS